MGIDIFSLKPTVVSRDLRGKIIFFYGDMKSGKTSNAVKFPKSLLLATEKGYNALNNIMAQNINKWSDFKLVLKQLGEEGAHDLFETIIVDTGDILFDLCEKYICQREGVDKIGEIPYGAGYGMVEKEYDEALRSIPLMGYGLVIISHSEDKEFTDENGEKFNKIVSTLAKRPRKIVNRMADIIGYSRVVDTEDGTKTYLYMRGTTRFEAGSRWKHTPNYIEFKYPLLVEAIAKAVEMQEQEDGITATDTYNSVYQDTVTYDFDEVKQEITSACERIMGKGDNAPKITTVVEKHLGKGKKVGHCTSEQLDMMVLILDDLKDLEATL